MNPARRLIKPVDGKGIHLIDLNDAPLEWRENPDCEMFPEISLLEIAFTHYIVSVPVLKAHTLCAMTGALKEDMDEE